MAHSKRKIMVKRAKERGCESVKEYLDAKQRARIQLNIDLLRAKLVIRNLQRRRHTGRLAYSLHVPNIIVHQFLYKSADNAEIGFMLKIIEVGQQILEQDARGDFYK